MTESDGMDYEDAVTAESYFGYKRNLQIVVLMSTYTNQSNIFEETFTFDGINLVGSLGGSLGLFVGFSFFGCVTPILDAVVDKVASFFLRINQSN